MSVDATPIQTLTPVVLEFENIRHEFKKSGETLRAVDDVSLVLRQGETLGIVGESGCGKSTLARIAAGLYKPTSGQVRVKDNDIGRKLAKGQIQDVQMVFQDPNGSLNPKMTVEKIVSEPLQAAGWTKASRKERVIAIVRETGLPDDALQRYPHEFSGGQRQRIALARALATKPSVLVLDEPTSALDVSIQAQILNLLDSIQRRESLSYFFISHNLGVIRYLSDRIAVMYLGVIVEIAPTERLFKSPMHPYSLALISAILDPGDNGDETPRVILEGEIPSPVDTPPGCPFSSRCWLADDLCRTVRPPLVEEIEGHSVACHKAGQAQEALISRSTTA